MEEMHSSGDGGTLGKPHPTSSLLVFEAMNSQLLVPTTRLAASELARVLPYH